jgi:hypothetical protein
MLTKFLELGPWKAAIWRATQDFPNILCKPYVHYRFDKSPPPVPILSEIGPVQSIPPHSASLRSILMFSVHFSLGRPTSQFPFLSDIS